MRDQRHPLFGRTFRVIRHSVHRGGGFPVSHEVEHRCQASLLIPVTITEPQNGLKNQTKLSVEALQDLISLAEQLESHVDQAGRSLGCPATELAAPNRRRDRGSAGGDAS